MRWDFGDVLLHRVARTSEGYIPQALESHLTGVAERCAGKLAPLQMPAVGYLCGIMHDSAKLLSRVQLNLLAYMGTEEHAVSGAAIAFMVIKKIFDRMRLREKEEKKRRLAKKNVAESEADASAGPGRTTAKKVLIETVILCIAGHHVGLDDVKTMINKDEGKNAKTTIDKNEDGRINKKRAVLEKDGSVMAAIEVLARSDVNAELVRKAIGEIERFASRLRTMPTDEAVAAKYLLMRMICGAMIQADREDAASFVWVPVVNVPVIKAKVA